MKKTTIYLPPDVDRAVSRIAEAEGITKAEAIRRALARAASHAPPPRLQAIGVVSGPGHVSEDVDAELRKTRFGES